MILTTGTKLSGRIRLRGFTLFEVLTVLSILAILFGAMVPVYRGAISNLRTRDFARDFAAALRFAQEQAIVRGVEYRVCLDEKEREYWVSRQVDPAKEPERFEVVRTDALRPTLFPDDVELWRVSAARGRQGDRQIRYITCYPNGRIAEARIELQGPDRRTITVRTAPTMGGVRIEEKRV